MSEADAEMIEVWLVEDNAAFRRGLSRTLNSDPEMCCRRQFETAEGLFVSLREETPDAVLLDVQLPGMDGISALQEIQGTWPELQTVVLTAFDDDDKIFRAVCAGASGYLLKSADRAEILSAIRQVMAGGAPMTPSVAKRVLKLFAGSKKHTPASADYELTSREQEILRLMADGLIKKEIADQLSISAHTVNTHIRSIYGKLHVNTNTGAVAKALREDLI